MMNKLKKNCILAIIIAAFFTVEMSGLFYDYSLNTIGDESVLLSASLKMINDFNWRPNYSSYYHLPFGVYVYLPLVGGFLLITWLLGIFPSIAAIKHFVILDYARLLPIARLISIFAGIGAVIMVYLITLRLFKSKPAALWASALTASSLLLSIIFHFGNVWSLHILAVLAAFYYIIRAYDSGRIKDYVKTGIWIGVTLGTHFIGVVVYASFLLTQYYQAGEEGLKKIFCGRRFWLTNLTVLLFLPIIYIMTPSAFQGYLASIARSLTGDQYGSGVINNINADNFVSRLIHFPIVLGQYEPILLILFIAASVYFISKKNRAFFLPLSFVVCYMLAMIIVGGNKFRYIAPILPFMAIIAGYGLSEFYSRAKLPRKIKVTMLSIIAAGLLYAPLAYARGLLQPSTRLEARHWIVENIPSGANIISLDKSLNLTENKETISDYEKYLPLSYLAKHKYLQTLDDENYPRPNYYILPLTDYYRALPPVKLPPREVTDKDYEYAIISWWDQADLERQIGLLDAEFDQTIVLEKRFPENTGADAIGYDLVGWFWDPYLNLMKVKFVGPIIDVYRIL